MLKKCLSMVLFMIVVTTGFGIRSAEAAVPVTSANLCGWLCTSLTGVGGNASADKLINTLAGVPSSGRPWIIALQEVCFSHIYYLAATLTGWGYSAHFGYSLADNRMVRPDLDCHEFGNAVFMRGTLNSPNDKWKLTYASQNTSDTGRGEWRNATCMRMNSNFLGCSTHLTVGPKNIQQATQFREFVDGYFPNHLRISAGDFNMDMTVNPNPVPTWQQFHWSVNPNNMKTFPSPTPTAQIDFIWGSKYNFANGDRWIIVDCSTRPASDHCYLYGTFNS